VVYTAPVVRAPSKIDRDIRDQRQRLSLLVEDATLALRGTANAGPATTPDVTELLIVDEADRLKLVGLEQLRDIYDRGRLGLILIGMPGLERRMARYPQLYSRVGFVHQYRPLGGEELRFVLEHKWARLGLTLDPTDFTDAEAIAAIAPVTGGKFRLVQRLFSQIKRLRQISGTRRATRTKESHPDCRAPGICRRWCGRGAGILAPHQSAPRTECAHAGPAHRDGHLPLHRRRGQHPAVGA
jgi:DNA transposition AAA+ family ATPase